MHETISAPDQAVIKNFQIRAEVIMTTRSTKKGMFCLITLMLANVLPHQIDAAGVTSLTNPKVRFERCVESYVKLQRGDVSIIVVDNASVDVPELSGHRAGYNGIASLRHVQHPENAFVPSIAGLNFEHIHDGTKAGLLEKFEPRVFPMELRQINAHTVELYQPPTGNWKLESCGRYSLLEDGTIEYTFECVPRKNAYSHGYIGLFWASYINNPADKAIYFNGRPQNSTHAPRWIKAITPNHGIDSTHPPDGLTSLVKVNPDFPLSLVGNLSSHEHVDSWYYGVTGGMALAFMFRPQDKIWFAQSPTGGGNGNPAWDFQWFIRDVRVGKAYGFTMRAAFIPFVSQAAMIRATKKHRDALGRH